MNKGTIVYIGGFELPDKNAAAHRVLSNAKLFRLIGYKVVFIDIDKDLEFNNNIDETKNTVEGFDRWSIGKFRTSAQSAFSLLKYRYVIKIIKKYKDVKFLIAYNFPAYALYKLKRVCEKSEIQCMADVTEWYSSRSKSLLYRLTKGTDTFLRMKFIHKRLDGLIVISKFLEKYYSDYTKTLYLPPLTDLNEKKWETVDLLAKENGKIYFVYAGSPSAEKESLDLIVDSILQLSHKYKINLKIIGLEKQAFCKIYQYQKKIDDKVVGFLGRKTHSECIEYVKAADFNFVIRPKNRVTEAGFPTKFAESISAGTPVIATDCSDLKFFIEQGKNGYLIDTEHLNDNLEKIINIGSIKPIQNNIFDYHNYMRNAKIFLEGD